MEKLKQNPIVKKLGLNRILLVCILIVMFAVFKVVLGNKFPVGDSIKSTLNYVYFLGFLSLGVTFVIATGGIDFSIGPVMFCCALDVYKRQFLKPGEAVDYHVDIKLYQK